MPRRTMSTRAAVAATCRRRRRRLLASFASGPCLLLLVLLVVGPALLLPPHRHLAGGQLIEHERIEEYRRRGYAWPPRMPPSSSDDDDEDSASSDGSSSDYIPDTPGWRQTWSRRFRQIEAMDDKSGGADRWNGFVSSVHCALLSPNFTENGWGVTRAPAHITAELKRRLHAGLNDASTPIEEGGHGVTGENMPWFVDTMTYNARVMEELRPLHEAWIGADVPLVGSTAYGLRVYRNASNLDMHVDQSQSHIISSILHVDHDRDSEPWPIVIEDLHGDLHEVVLESGDMLLYESSKCMHGRPANFIGSWYSSLFVHYRPVEWDGRKIHMDSQYRVPPGWVERKVDGNEDLDELKVVETSFHEPGCENNWCGLKDAIRWRGPAEGVGKVLSRGGVTTTLDVPKGWLADDEL